MSLCSHACYVQMSQIMEQKHYLFDHNAPFDKKILQEEGKCIRQEKGAKNVKKIYFPSFGTNVYSKFFIFIVVVSIRAIHLSGQVLFSCLMSCVCVSVYASKTCQKKIYFLLVCVCKSSFCKHIQFSCLKLETEFLVCFSTKSLLCLTNAFAYTGIKETRKGSRCLIIV